MSDNQRRHPTEQADLYGRRVVICQRDSRGRRLNEVLVKQLTGSDPITGGCTRISGSSSRPGKSGYPRTTSRKTRDRPRDMERVRLIPFNVTFHDVGQGTPVKDLRMEEKLTAELRNSRVGGPWGAFLQRSGRDTSPSGRVGRYRTLGASQDTMWDGWMNAASSTVARNKNIRVVCELQNVGVSNQGASI